MEHSLTRFGFDPRAEADFINALKPQDRLPYLAKQLETHELHVVRNHVVSLPYNYWFSDGKIFTNKRHSLELTLDEKERGGLYKQGIIEAFKLAKDNPYQLVYQYSPPGPASFRMPPDPEYAKPYNIGQLYLMYFDGENIKNISISINGEAEKWVAEILGDKYFQILKQENKIEQIKSFITTPVLSHLTIDDFLNYNWQNSEQIIFTSNSLERKTKYTLADVLQEIRNSFGGQLRGKINTELIASRILQGDKKVTKENINMSYCLVIGQVMRENKVKTTALGGGCGGSVVSESDILDFNPVSKLESISNLSSNYRKLIQGEDKKKENYFTCPNCGIKLKPPVGNCCPRDRGGCGMTKETWAELHPVC